jgi:hypothetical protein
MNKEVLEAIQTERDYQDRETAKPDRPDMIDMGIADILLAMQINLDKACEVWYYDSEPYQDTMEFVRKITALGVKAGETYGMPHRESV